MSQPTIPVFRVQVKLVFLILLFILLVPVAQLKAEDEKKATIQLVFDAHDSVKTCKAVVTSGANPVKGSEVHFYVKRWYNPLPIGKAVETDEKGEASIEFPGDIPGDEKGNLTVIAKLEDDDTYGTVETQADVKWAGHPRGENDKWSERSLSASREKAPMYLIIVSNLIIAVIWGTIFYVIFQVFKIKKESRLQKKKI